MVFSFFFRLSRLNSFSLIKIIKKLITGLYIQILIHSMWLFFTLEGKPSSLVKRKTPFGLLPVKPILSSSNFMQIYTEGLATARPIL